MLSPTTSHAADHATVAHPIAARRYPVTVTVDCNSHRSRITTLLRLPLAIPLMIAALLYSVLATAATVIAWPALIITRRWPLGLYELAGGVLRFTARANGYILLAVERYPPLGLSRGDDYPVRVHIDPPLLRYSRLKVLLRAIYIIPAYLGAYAVTILAYVTWIASWWAIVSTGRQPAALQNATVMCLNYTTRFYALTYLLTETYPPFAGQAQPQQHRGWDRWISQLTSRRICSTRPSR